MINHNNRPTVVVNLGALNAAQVLPALYAHKKMKVLGAAIIQEGAISASGANYLTLDLKIQDAPSLATPKDTQAGLAARTALELLDEGEELILEKGEYLSLDVAETGDFVEGTDSILVLDLEVVGN
jgi:hypothetical protein